MATKDEQGNLHSEADGRFTSQGGGDAGTEYNDDVNRRIRWANDNGVDLPLNADGSLNDIKLQALYDKNSAPPKTAYGFSEKKLKHAPDHVRHAKEMGYKNQDEYERAAIGFWERGNGEVYHGSRRDRFAKYNEKTGEYVVVDKDGYVKTYFFMNKKKFTKYSKQEGFNKWEK